MPLNVPQVDASIIAAFGETILYTPDGGGQVSILGLYQSPDVDPVTGDLEFTTQGPMVTVLATDVTNPTKLDLVTVPSVGQNYQVKEFEIDEGGLVGLQLEETV